MSVDKVDEYNESVDEYNKSVDEENEESENDSNIKFSSSKKVTIYSVLNFLLTLIFSVFFILISGRIGIRMYEAIGQELAIGIILGNFTFLLISFYMKEFSVSVFTSKGKN